MSFTRCSLALTGEGAAPARRLPRRVLRAGIWAVLPALAVMGQAEAQQPESHLLVIGGLGGDAEYRALFHQWASDLIEGAARAGIDRSRITYLAEKPERDADRIDGESRREGVEAALRRLTETTTPGDRVFIVLIGHGSFRDSEARFNLPGQDLTAKEYDALLAGLADREVVFVNTASASGPFIEALAGPGRVIVTATRSGRESNQTRFGGFFVAALAEDGADVDKNGRVSVLEAFQYARAETERSYASANRIATEHALFDDDGDGEGSAEPADGGDGARAAAWFFGPGRASVAAAASGDTVLVRLHGQKRDVEARIQALQDRRDTLDPTEYRDLLEELLVELALVDRQIREREGSR